MWLNPGSTLYSFEDQQVRLAPDEGGVLHCECDKHPNDVSELKHNKEEVQDPSCPRLSRQFLEVEEWDVSEDSLDEGYLTPSIEHNLSDCHQPYRSILCSLEEQLACSALDVAYEYSTLKVIKFHWSPSQATSIYFCFCNLYRLRHDIPVLRLF
uniref:neuroblastoma breakpoint family member 6-like n=1 Tax=Macaca mulatta TaxID=9544 RepID=UPI0005F42DD2|nr:neuroblastoma breakpoint family member 6-like [Macaca nemestrina]XP_014986823.1 neuroblastoma breakpoint family member 6-like [Macaca mulatta]XP_015301157.1 neuroblastoma breakpoint family member 6-like [Macaca fascicularis]